MTDRLQAKKLDIFASDSAASTKIIGKFGIGEQDVSKDPDVLQEDTAAVIGGWLETVLSNKTPALDHFNTMQYLVTRKLKELQQQGIPEFILGEEYHEFGIVRKKDTYELYGSKIANNTEDLPDRVSDDNWEFIIDISQTGGLPKNFADYNIFYGGEFDATRQYFPINNPIYDYTNYTYTLNGSNQYIDTLLSDVNFKGAEEFTLQAKFEITSSNTISVIFGQTANTTEQIIYQVRRDIDGISELYLSSNGSNWDIASQRKGSYVYELNTIYTTRLRKTATQYIVEVSDDDGQTWVQDLVIDDTRTLTDTRVTLGCHLYGTDRYLNGKIYLDGCLAIVNGVQKIRPQDVDYIPNSVIVKGSWRDDTNVSDIIVDDYIRDVPIFNANDQYIINGSGIDTYDYTNFTFNLDGTINTAPYAGLSGYSASDFDARVKFEFSNSNNAQPIIGLGSGSGNLGIVLKTNASGLMQLFVSSNGTTWDISNGLTGTKIYNIDTVYIVRVYRDASNWYLDYSDDDGQTWTNDITANSSLVMFEQTLNINWGGDYTPGTDIFMTGKIYLDNTSLFLNGEYALKPQDPSTSTLPYHDYYYFIGFDEDNNIKIERTINKDGSDLEIITGFKRHIGSEKDVTIPTNGLADLAYFERNYGTWGITLWDGVSSATGLVKLNSSFDNFNSLQFTHELSHSGGGYRNISNVLVSDFSLMRTESGCFEIRRSSATTDYATRYTSTNDHTVVNNFFLQNFPRISIKGVK